MYIRTMITLLLALSTAACTHTASHGHSANVGGTKNALGAAQSEAGTLVPLTPNTIRKIVESHFAEIQQCYELQLATTPLLRGMVELELTITQDGTIESGKLLKDSLGSAALNLCLVQKMLDWKFPAHADESVTIQFPFAFSPKAIAKSNRP